MNIYYLFVLNFILIIIDNVNSFNYDLNKVIIHKPPYLKNNNFGYSVAGYKVDNDSWILVGAPLTPRERPRQNTNKEGAIYRCKINIPNSCFMLPFDKRDDWHEVRDQYGIYYNENKTNQLLGATLKVSNDVIMACAPNYRYVVRVFKNEFRYEPTGICYTLKDKMRKFEEYAPCKNYMWGYNRQGFCQAGFSAALSYNTSSLVISGPGAWYWEGMIFSLNLTNKEIKHKYPEKSGEGKEDDSYRGYSLDIGHFDNDTIEDVVVSAPRGINCKGFVEVFSSTLKLLHVIHGYQIGAYFGASVIVTDINNDSYDDIVIGSPLYRKDKENYDIGRIEIFIRDTKNLNVIKFINTSIDGYKAASRFGYTIAKLGDVNDDGYNDIAVAAPYDDNGIVYIYHGNSNGLNKIPDQIIKGSNYNLKTFGYSLSGNLDLDHNKYPDLIIGAYKSDAAVLVRTRPVVKSTVIIQTTPKVIDLDSRTGLCDKNKEFICMELEMCVQYNGKSVPSVLRMKLIWELDIDKSYNDSRALFQDTNTNMLTQNFTYKYNVKKCVKQIIQIKKNIRDKLTPIKCKFNKILPEYDSDWELMPVFDNKQNTSKIHEIRFLKNCGNDDICIPNLQVTASTPSKKYIYGSKYNIDINIQIFNKKEDAFESQCIITLPYGVNYVKTFSSPTFMANQSPLQCTQSKSELNETRVICDIGNPIVSNSGKSFTIRVAPETIMPDQEILMFNVTVTSSNKEDKSTIFDNEHHVYVVLDAVPGLALIGKQYQEQVIYETRFDESSTSDYENETQIGPEIIHEYKIINKGPSEFSTSELLITWQSQLEINEKKLSFMYLMETPYLEGPIKCNIDYKLINPFNITVFGGDSLKNPEKYFKSGSLLDQMYEPFRVLRSFNTEIDYYMHSLERYINCASGIYKKENKKDESISFINKREAFYLNYKKTELYDLYCGSIHCNIDQLKIDESAIIRLRFRLWASTLALDSEVYSVKSFGTAIVTETPYEKLTLDLNAFQSSTQIETIAHPRERKQISQPLDVWIVFLSIFAGVILLVLLIILLWCCGFFKRFEPQEITKFSEAMSTEDDTGTNDVIDISKQCVLHSSNTLDKNTLLIKSPPPPLTPLPPPPPPPPPPLLPSLSISASSLLSSSQQQQQQKSRSNHKIATHLNNLYTDLSKQNNINNTNNLQHENLTSDHHNHHQLHNQSTISSSVYILPINKTSNEANDNLMKSSPSQSVKFTTFYNNNKNNNNNQPGINMTNTSFSNQTTSTNTNSNMTNDTYTTKLPPVPKRTNLNNTSNIHNLINLNQKLSNSSSIINDNNSSTAKYAILNAAIMNNSSFSSQNDRLSNNNNNNNITRGSFDTMNYKMLAKQQQQQQQQQQHQLNNFNKNVNNNPGYATYRSTNTKRNLNNTLEFSDKRLNFKNEHNI